MPAPRTTRRPGTAAGATIAIVSLTTTATTALLRFT